MGVSRIGQGTTVNNFSDSSAVGSHASTAVGDRLIMLVGGRATVTGISGGSGSTWAQFGSTVNVNLLQLQVWTKIAASGDHGGASFTTTTTPSAYGRVLSIQTYRGAALTPELRDFQSETEASSGTDIVADAYTMASGEEAITLGANQGAAAVCTITGTGWTELFEAAQSSTYNVCVALGTNTGTAVEGATFTWGAAGSHRAAFNFVVYEPHRGAMLHRYSTL